MTRCRMLFLALASTVTAQALPLVGTSAELPKGEIYPLGPTESVTAPEGARKPQLWSRANVATGRTPSPGTVWVKPGDPIPVRTWVERLGPVPSDTCNPSGDSGQQIVWNAELCNGFPPGKHMRMFYHPPSKSMVIAGGDRGVSMPRPGYYDGTGSEIIGLNVEQDKFKILRPFCVRGEVQPNRPDTSPWAYDSKRDQGIQTPGYYFMSGSGCGAIEGWGAYAFDFATKKYIGPNDIAGLPQPPEGGGGKGWGGDNGASFGFYVAKTDEFCRLRMGPRLECLNRTTKVWRTINLSIGKSWNPNTNRAQPALDEQGRVVYWLDLFSELAGGDRSKPGTPYLAKTSLVDGSTTRIPVPSQWVNTEGSGNDIYLAFDPINRLVLIPNSFGMGATPLSGLGIFHVDSSIWEWETTVPTAVMGSVWGFDENMGALVGLGKRTQPYAYYFWKYGPKP